MQRIFFLRFILFLVLLGIGSTVAKGQAQDTLASNKNRLFVLPLAFFSPETNWGFGAAGIYTFRLGEEPISSRPSQLQMGFAYTLNKQVLLYLPFKIFKQEEHYQLYGELGYYLYTYQFYGIGNQTTASNLEFYDVDYPRVRLNLLKEWKPNFYAGFRYWLDDYKIKKIEAGGILEQEQIVGYEGGLLSGLGLVLNYDNRDNIFFPSKGLFIEAVGFANGAYLGSDFNFSKFYLDASTFFAKKEHILAFNAYIELTGGNVPFYQMALLGGNKRMRGFFEGQFRDNHFVSLQTEYRFPLFWKWLRGVAFVGLGEVSNQIEDFAFSELKYSYGTGLRILINSKEKVYVRLDAGFGKDTSGYYITIGEAF